MIEKRSEKLLISVQQMSELIERQLVLMQVLKGGLKMLTKYM